MLLFLIPIMRKMYLEVKIKKFKMDKKLWFCSAFCNWTLKESEEIFGGLLYV
jgi:hypothetical protein